MNISNRTFANKMFWINKRLFDIFVCLLLIPLFFIISIILLFVNYFFNSGSLFFIQERMGKNCSVFSAVKFRSMAPVKEITRKYDDPIETDRITSIGKILRKSRIDELPQILNVLKGDMSLVGPRPEVRKYVDLYTEEQKRVLTIRPGITDWASINYRDENVILGKSSNPEKDYIEKVMPDKLGYNMIYINKYGVLEYLKIIFK